MTGVDPDARFDKQKAWIQSNRFVRQYGLRLLPQLHTLNGTPSCEQAAPWESTWRSMFAAAGTASVGRERAVHDRQSNFRRATTLKDGCPSGATRRNGRGISPTATTTDVCNRSA
jgi:hypothetical protein